MAAAHWRNGTLNPDGPVVCHNALQEDTFIPTMSCQETLEFYAAMSLPQSASRAQKKARVAEALGAVGLSAAASTLVRPGPVHCVCTATQRWLSKSIDDSCCRLPSC